MQAAAASWTRSSVDPVNVNNVCWKKRERNKKNTKTTLITKQILFISNTTLIFSG